MATCKNPVSQGFNNQVPRIAGAIVLLRPDAWRTSLADPSTHMRGKCSRKPIPDAQRTRRADPLFEKRIQTQWFAEVGAGGEGDGISAASSLLPASPPSPPHRVHCPLDAGRRCCHQKAFFGRYSGQKAPQTKNKLVSSRPGHSAQLRRDAGPTNQAKAAAKAAAGRP